MYTKLSTLFFLFGLVMQAPFQLFLAFYFKSPLPSPFAAYPSSAARLKARARLSSTCRCDHHMIPRVRKSQN